MMGHHEKMEEGNRWDGLLLRRRFRGFRAGTRRWMKRCASKRVRRGERMRAARARIVESGAELLDWDGVAREVAERRGGIEAVEWMEAVRAWAASFPQIDGEIDCDRGVLNERDGDG